MCWIAELLPRSLSLFTHILKVFVFWFTYRNIHPLGLAPTAPIDCNLLMTGSLFSAGVAMSFSTLIFVHRAAILWKSNLFVSRIFLPSLWLAQVGLKKALIAFMPYISADFSFSIYTFAYTDWSSCLGILGRSILLVRRA